MPDERVLTSGTGQITQASVPIFTDDTVVVPDLSWIDNSLLSGVIVEKGICSTAPDLPVVSPGKTYQECNHTKKCTPRDRHSVSEHLIADRRAMTTAVFRSNDDALRYVATLQPNDSSPLLPGFSCKIERFFTI
ncbi:MAG: hypothetical protein ACUVSY_11005 [Roseiflexus sp.]